MPVIRTYIFLLRVLLWRVVPDGRSVSPDSDAGVVVRRYRPARFVCPRAIALVFLPALFSVFLLLWVSHNPAYPGPRGAELAEIRHGVHSRSGFSRLVFEIRGAGRLHFPAQSEDGDVLSIHLKDVLVIPALLRCNTPGFGLGIPVSISPAAALCVMNGDLVEAVEASRGSAGEVKIAVHLRNARVRDLMVKPLVLAGAGRREGDARFTRLIVDIASGASVLAKDPDGWLVLSGAVVAGRPRRAAPEKAAAGEMPPAPRKVSAPPPGGPIPEKPEDPSGDNPLLFVKLEGDSSPADSKVSAKNEEERIIRPSRGRDETGDLPAPARKRSPVWGVFTPNLETAMRGNLKIAALRSLKPMADLWLPYVGGNAFQDWVKRLEFEVDIEEDGKTNYSLLTVQPIVQFEDRIHTIFTQLRIDETTANAGLGYRRLLLGNSVLVGANSFYDWDYDKGHRRLGFGVELKWNAFDLRGNIYEALSGLHSVGHSRLEEALDGYDYEFTSQVPYLPWARFHAGGFFWNARTSKNIKGYRLAMELDLHPNFQVELGISDDNASEEVWFTEFRFRVGDNRIPVASRAQWHDTEPFRARDMRDQTLVKVRRQNTIVVERSVVPTVSGGSIVITRVD